MPEVGAVLSGSGKPVNRLVRNVAVIAHVDHGKTTLVDALLKQTGTFRKNEAVDDRVLDSFDLEKERGITILAKNTAIHYKDIKINIVDTPGHADFGGEVERTLGMVDGALLLVDACDGPMPQTRFVVRKALEHRIKLILVINKIDRPDARLNQVYEEVFDLLVNLGANDDDVDFPVVYCDARRGFATVSLEEAAEYSGEEGSVFPLLEAIVKHVPPPSARPGDPLQIMVSALAYDDYVGRIAVGRVEAGAAERGQTVALCRTDGTTLHAEISGLYVFAGLKRCEVEKVEAGDIAAISGIPEAGIGETLADPTSPKALPGIQVEKPTVMVTISVNDSPFSGNEGTYVTSRHLRDRLYKETQKDVSLGVEDTASPDSFRVSGRGDLHLSILIETMRREGYEMSVSRPEVIFQTISGKKCEPIEELVLDLPEEHTGRVMEELGPRKAELLDMHPDASGRMKLRFSVPTRGLLGFRSEFLTITKGTGIMNHRLDHYDEYRGSIVSRLEGAMISWETGVTTAYGLHNAEERGILFVGPGEPVYAGQIVGEHSRPMDLDINVCKKKHLTNMRASQTDQTVRLKPWTKMTLESALQWIADDELIEVTPRNIRLRKGTLARDRRYKMRKEAQGPAEAAPEGPPEPDNN